MPSVSAMRTSSTTDRAHLAHELAAMGFHRRLTNIESSGDLFVLQTRYHEHQNLAFPKRQPSKTLIQFGQSHGVLVSGSIALDSELDGIQEFLFA
jgi:hypothetical protein